MRCIKLFGVERAGVSFIKRLLEQNDQNVVVLEKELGRICDRPPKDVHSWSKNNPKLFTQDVNRLLLSLRRGEKLHPIIVIKNPYSWYKSIARYRSKRFINMEKEIKIYNEVYGFWAEFLSNSENETGIYGKGVVVRYESVLKDEEKFLKALFRFLNIPIQKELNITKELEYNYKFTEKMRAFYLSGGPYKIDTDMIDRITRLINWEVINGFYDYVPINPLTAYPFSVRDQISLGKLVHPEVTAILEKYLYKEDNK